ncbi:MAG: hypothetical protein QNJ48_15040 [Desulfobacterales bacterium]|nr:hypothetical protein [Desulfobacterales bacterium]MDJ0885481.1 hypothetical protein [Desulfobacterales bacterium]
MIKSANRLRDQTMPTSGERGSIDCGYFGLDADIARALGQRSHLGYCADHETWASDANDFGYYAMNRSIMIALKRLARS